MSALTCSASLEAVITMGRPSLIVAIFVGTLLLSAALVAAEITIDPNSLSVNTRSMGTPGDVDDYGN